MKKTLINFLFILSLIFLTSTSKLFAQNLKDLEKKAANALRAASSCYLSLPSQAQSGASKTMLEAQTFYNDAVKYSNMSERHLAGAFFDNAITYSGIVIQIGSAYGSKTCK
jgi:hypothetical protein